MFTVKYLNDQEFDRLPYKHVHEAVGCADPKTQTAYVRRSGVRVIDQFVTEHEIDELINKYSDHEVDGIRYKRGRDIFRIAGPILLGGLTGGLGLPAWVGALGGAGLGFGLGKGKPMERLPGAAMGALGGYGASGLGKGVATGWKEAGEKGLGLFGKIGGAAKGAAAGLGFGQGAAAGSAGASQGSAAGSPAFGINANPIISFPNSSVGSSISWGARPAVTSSANWGAGIAAASPITGGVSSLAPASTSAVPEAMKTLGFQKTSEQPSFIDKVLGKQGSFGRTATGLGLPLVGEAFTSTSDVAKQSLTDQSNLYKEVLARVRQGTQAPLSAGQETAIASKYQDAKQRSIEAMKDQFKRLMPGSDVESSSEYQRAIAEINADFDTRIANETALIQLGLTQQQTENLAELANLEVYELARIAGITTQEAAEFKDLLGQLGYGIMQGTFG